jgi:hypothetical protein
MGDYMFKVEINEISSKTDKLLYNIQEILLSMTEKEFPDNPDIDKMNRTELLKLIKTLPKGSIKGKYMTFPIEKLREEVKAVL